LEDVKTSSTTRTMDMAASRHEDMLADVSMPEVTLGAKVECVGMWVRLAKLERRKGRWMRSMAW
jgi:hypothetical protein